MSEKNRIDRKIDFMIECVNVNTLEVYGIPNIKMADIARMAGVSLATVGRVIHQNGYVSEENRVKIEAIIQETGYVPNRIAQGLKSSRSKLIGHMTLFNPNMLYEQIALSLNEAAYELGYQVLTLVSHNNRLEEARQVEELIGHQVDGVVITSNPYISRNLIDKFLHAKIPVVLVERTQNIPSTDCIKIDDFSGAYKAVRQMTERGHTQIGFIGMKISYEVEQLRFQGYRTALEDAGIAFQESLVCQMDNFQINFGKQGAKQLMSGDIVPTAIFVTSDLFACGVLQHCYEKKIRVPEDLSLSGYDNTLSAMLAPPITSMELPCSQIGHSAMDFLQRRMENWERSDEEVLIEPRLVNRETVRKRNER